MLPMADDFSRLMEAAQKLKGCETATEVAKLLGIIENGDQLMTNWKSRGLPRARINEISKIIGCNPYWLEDGDGVMEYVCATTQAEAKVILAMQQMAKYELEDNIQTVVKISDSLAEQTKKNGTQ
jgi:hypothetical protein